MKKLLWVGLVYVALLYSVCGAYTYVQFGDEFGIGVRERLISLVQQGSPNELQIIGSSSVLNITTLPSNSIVLSFGLTPQTQLLISEQEVNELPEESYIVRSTNYQSVLLLVTNGKSQSPMNPFVVHANIGFHYGCYELLRQLGYAFLHPLQPIVPSPWINPPQQLNITQSPMWEIRTWHYHTEHPLEICEFLQGMNSSDTPWEDMKNELALYGEWLIANRQNRLEFLVLWTQAWDEFAWSSLRQSRLREINSILHGWGLASGADVPIAEKQQHAWYMTGPHYSKEVQYANISRHIDWMMEADFDFLSTESGYSEFTHPNCTLMLDWMNFTTSYLINTYPGKKIYIKCHCSSGQTCADYPNPYTGEPLNFNFLPAYAVADLGIYPHTVQIYNLTEPAPTYGNTNFTYMLEFLVQECGSREVVFHGESAYWVNYDINVPLFLPPIYGNNRIADMRAVYSATKARSKQAQGQSTFESGWEWSYWLGNSMAAAAVWNPRMDVSQDEAVAEILKELFYTFGDQDLVSDLTSTIQQIIELESRLFIYGNWNGTAPSTVALRNAQAYLEGWDTWSQWSNIVDQTDLTQPSKLSFHDMRSPLNILLRPNLPDYESEIQPLLQATQLNLTSALKSLTNLQSRISPQAMPFFSEMVDTLNITVARATEVFALYQYVWGKHHKSHSWLQNQASIAENAIYQAQEIVQRREANYRVPVERIASWRNNPTAYQFTYLWSAHSLYYFWRDYSQATTVDIQTLTPCFMNIITPIDVAFGTGKALNVSIAIGNWLNENGLSGLGECLQAPLTEPVYPLTPIITSSGLNIDEESLRAETKLVEDFYRVIGTVLDALTEE